ncbi:MAG: acyl transferase [Chlorobi bacterium]|nr:acyl transferase [Chlorobiota bacterium]
MKKLENEIFQIKSEKEFEKSALKIFRFQAANNNVYKTYLNNLHIDINSIKSINSIPFLPIEFFKTQEIKTGSFTPKVVFFSSGTSGMTTSKHYVRNTELYEQSFKSSFQLFYGNITDYCILALLPSYLEREGSSLVYMVNNLIQSSKNTNSGFYLNNYTELAEKLFFLEKQKQKTLLIGVSFALLDFIENNQVSLQHTIVMETGGMKGRRKELIREELHQKLTSGFRVKTIHSEYGMTELLSQSYSPGNGIYKTPPWMKILIRDTYNPFSYLETGKSGGINIIDLANIHSCSFIETKDIGKKFNNESFTILGRFDNSDIRGCNLMID